MVQRIVLVLAMRKIVQSPHVLGIGVPAATNAFQSIEDAMVIHNVQMDLMKRIVVNMFVLEISLSAEIILDA